MKTFETPKRVWINQPSTQQPLNKYHGLIGIAHTKPDGETILYFTKGSLISMKISNTNCLETKNSQNNIFEYDI